MFFKTRNSVKILNVDLDLSAMPSMCSAKLISIVGSGQLKKQMAPLEDERYAYHSLITMTLNQIPLVRMIQPGCPTCASLLAAGLGIEHADCEALRKLEDPLNQPFVSLNQSITQLKPLLSLLESGLYVIAEGICMPTDGEGHFFWDIQNTWTESAATAGAFIGSDYEYVNGWPLYLYPTETSACLNPERVTHYEELFRTSAARPRAVVYHLNEFMNFILDGHHKACAVARLRQPLDCLFIIPVSGIAYSRDSKRKPKQFYFSSIPVSADQLPARFQAAFHPLRREEKAVKLQDLSAYPLNSTSWDAAYRNSAQFYPTVVEAAEMAAAGLNWNRALDDKQLYAFLRMDVQDKELKTMALFNYLRCRRDPRLKALALTCLDDQSPKVLRKAAYQALRIFPEDPEVEQRFIDYLVQCDDPHDEILPLIHSFWDQQDSCR